MNSDGVTVDSRSTAPSGAGELSDTGLLSVHAHLRLGVAAASMSLLGLLLAWSVVTPALRGPDEPAHVSSTSRLARSGAWEPRDQAAMDPAIVVANHSVGFSGTVWWAENPPLGPVGAGQGPHSPPLDELRNTVGAAMAPLSDPAAGHPPAYYAVLALPWSVLNLDQQTPSGAVLGLRLFSLLLILPVPWLIAVAGAAVELRAPAVVAATFVPSAWIQFVHIGAAVNNGALVVLTSSLVVALCIPVLLRSEVGRVRALSLGLITSLGVLSKGFAFGLIPIVILAYVVAMKRSDTRAAARALFWAITGMLPGVLWWLLNLDRLFRLAPAGASNGGGEGATVQVDVSIMDWLPRALADLSGSFWANLGWLNTPLPPPLHFGASAVFTALVALGIWRYRHQPALVVVLTATWAVPLLMISAWSVRYFIENGFVDGMQGRYLHAGVVAFAVFVAAALQPFDRLLRLFPFAAVAAGIAGLVFGLRQFWEPPTLGLVVTWWPAGDAVAWAAGCALTASLAILILTLRVDHRRRRTETGPGACAQDLA